MSRQNRPYLNIEDVQSIKLSDALKFDQMTRQFKRHAEGSMAQGESYKDWLLQSIQKKNSLMQKQRQQLAVRDEQDVSDDLDLESQLNTICILLKKRATAKSETYQEDLAKAREKFLESLRKLEEDLEYLNIQIILKNREENPDDGAQDSEVQDLDSLIEEMNSSKQISISTTEELDPFTMSKHQLRKIQANQKSITLRREKVMDDKIKTQEQEIITLKAKLMNLKKDEDTEALKKELQHQKQLIKQIESELQDEKTITERQKEGLRLLNDDYLSLKQAFENTSRELSELHKVQDSHRSEANREQSSNQESKSIEQGNYHDADRPMNSQEIKALMKTIKDSLPTPISPYTISKERGLKTLETEFIRTGRKTWTDKEVTQFIQLLERKSLIASTDERTKIILNEVEESDSQIHELWSTIQLFGRKIKELIANIKDNNTKWEEECSQKDIDVTELQTIYLALQIELQDKLDKLVEMVQQQLDIFQSTYLLSPISVLKEIKTNFVQQMQSTATELKEIITKTIDIQSTTSTIPKRLVEQRTTQLTEDKKLYSKILIIPKNNTSLSQVQKQIREELKQSEVDMTEITTRTTKNKNLQILSTDVNLDQLKQIVDNSENLKETLEVVEPHKRRMRLLLLNVPEDIKQIDLESELTNRHYFTDDDYKIMKSIETNRRDTVNWLLETNASDCRKITKQQRLQIYTENIRVVHHIRVLRCTNCQCFQDHYTHACEWATECGRCAGEHATTDCSSTIQACVNCRRERLTFRGHSAISPTCPIYQKAKSWRLAEYYKKDQYQENTAEIREQQSKKPRNTRQVNARTNNESRPNQEERAPPLNEGRHNQEVGALPPRPRRTPQATQSQRAPIPRQTGTRRNEANSRRRLAPKQSTRNQRDNQRRILNNRNNESNNVDLQKEDFSERQYRRNTQTSSSANNFRSRYSQVEQREYLDEEDLAPIRSVQYTNSNRVPGSSNRGYSSYPNRDNRGNPSHYS